MKFRICCNWQFASTVATIAIDITWNIVVMWLHAQQIALIHHDLNKEWIWDLICIIRKSFEIFILFKLKIPYSQNSTLFAFVACKDVSLFGHYHVKGSESIRSLKFNRIKPHFPALNKLWTVKIQRHFKDAGIKFFIS